MNIIPMNYEGKEVRTVTDETTGEIMWVAKDVAEVLGYVNHNDAISRHCRGVVKRYPIIDSLGRTQEARIIHEPDLYRLIVNSKLESAQKFEAWIFDEVLPTIRRTGGYASLVQAPQTAVPVAREFRALLAIAKMAGLHGNPAILSASNATRKLTGQDPLALIGATHLIAEEQKRHFTSTELGLILGGMSGMKFNLLLADRGLQESRGTGKKKYWVPTEKGKNHSLLVDTGKRHGDGSMVQQVRWFETVLSEVGPASAQ